MEIFLELKKLRLLYYEEEKSHSTAQVENGRRSAHPMQRSNEFRHGYFEILLGLPAHFSPLKWAGRPKIVFYSFQKLLSLLFA